MKPIDDEHGNLGVEFWFPDWVGFPHSQIWTINDKKIMQRIRNTLSTRCKLYEIMELPFPEAKNYFNMTLPLNHAVQSITIDTDEIFMNKGEEKTKHGMFSEETAPTGTPALNNKSIAGYLTYDAVNHPQHYTQSGIECIDAIDSVTSGYERPGHGYYAGQVLKYLWRAPFKGHYLQDLEKAQWYLNRLVKKVQDEADHGN